MQEVATVAVCFRTEHTFSFYRRVFWSFDWLWC